MSQANGKKTLNAALAACVLIIAWWAGQVLAAPPANVPTTAPIALQRRPTVYLIGDSTVRNGSFDNGATKGQWGWGHMFHYYFDEARIQIVNDAMGGTSSRSYFNSPQLWPLVLARIQPGDYVIMQFGTNDGAPAYRASLRGNGNDALKAPQSSATDDTTAPTDDPLTLPATVATRGAGDELIHTFGWYLRQFIVQSRARGATPIVCSLTPRNRWRNGTVARSSRDYALWAQQAAEQEGVAFIPLNDLISNKYEKVGPDKVTAEYFPLGETLHTNWAGARLNAGCVVDGLKALKDCPLKDYLIAEPKVPVTPDINPPSRGELGPAGVVERAPTSRRGGGR